MKESDIPGDRLCRICDRIPPARDQLIDGECIDCRHELRRELEL